MCTDFVLKVKCTIVELDRGLSVYLDLDVSDFRDVLVLFSKKKHLILEGFLVLK